jgi:CRISPR-associated protein Cmr5
MRTRDQRLAALTFRQVRDVPEAERQKYGTAAHRLPMLIRTAGLVQALAFMKSRRKTGIDRLLADLSVAVIHLPESLGDAGETTAADGDELLAQSRDGELTTYMLLTTRALQALGFLRRYVKSELKIDASEDMDAGDATAESGHAAA